MNIEKNDLRLHWLIVWIMLATLLAYLCICLLFSQELQQPIEESQRVILRSIFYASAIIGLPTNNLIRHIMLRLAQTMPSNKSAKNRYLLIIGVSMVLAESIGVMGLVMFILGDGFNTLYIFTGLSALGMYLYRPKNHEYERIVAFLNDNA